MMLRCLWLARSLPFPLTAGDRIYTAKLASALAASGVAVTFVGFAGETKPTSLPGVEWRVVPGGQGGKLTALIKSIPLVAARHATPAYRRTVGELAASGPWDAVVIDQYGMGWVLQERSLLAGRPVLVFVTHDHEESVTAMQWRNQSASLLDRAMLAQNHLKTRWFERWIGRQVDVITTITESDGELFGCQAPNACVLPLVPGYDGPQVKERTITAEVPRSVVMLGSYRWSAKQANLHIFLDKAAPALQAIGVGIEIVGDMPDDLRSALSERYPKARFTGFVADPAPYLAHTRMAVLAEPIGGGFKMKLLEYVFNRVPVAALETCVAGLPQDMRAHFILAPDIDMLLRRVAETIDDLDRLNAMQSRAFACAVGAFDWADRGRRMRDVLLDQRVHSAKAAA